MLIWRHLDPQTLGRLLAHAAERRAAERRARRHHSANPQMSGASPFTDQASPRGPRLGDPPQAPSHVGSASQVGAISHGKLTAHSCD
jgi:hypothetical protein